MTMAQIEFLSEKKHSQNKVAFGLIQDKADGFSFERVSIKQAQNQGETVTQTTMERRLHYNTIILDMHYNHSLWYNNLGTII